MAYLIDKDALVAEIEKRRSKNARNKLNLAAAFEDNYLLTFINSLEVKEVDLEQAAKDESDDDLYAIHLEKWNITGECPSELEAKIDAKFGITGRDSNGKPSNGYCDWKKDVFTNGASIYSFVKLGMDYQKEQMMKDSIDAVVEKYDGIQWLNKNIPQLNEKLSHFQKGDKVKVIIVKDND